MRTAVLSLTNNVSVVGIAWWVVEEKGVSRGVPRPRSRAYFSSVVNVVSVSSVSYDGMGHDVDARDRNVLLNRHQDTIFGDTFRIDRIVSLW